MKKLFILLMVAVLTLGVVGTAFAALIDVGPLPDDTNVGCSGAFWGRNDDLAVGGDVIFSAEFGSGPDSDMLTVATTKQRGVKDGGLTSLYAETATGYINWATFGDSLTDVELQAVYDAGLLAGKDDFKDIVEYLKLWNKGYIDPDTLRLVKTCPKKGDW